MKYSWQMPEKWNKCIVLSCFRRASTVVFNPQCNQEMEGSAIQTMRKDGGLLQQNSFEKEGEKPCLEDWNDEGDWQLSLPSRESRTSFVVGMQAQPGAVGKIKTWASPNSPLPGLDVCKWLWPLISQPKLAVCYGPHFLLGFKKICLLEASTWWKNEKLGSKSHNSHSCFSTIFQHWSGPGKTPTEAKQTRTK